MDNILKTIKLSHSHVYILAGILLTYLGFRIAFDRKFLDGLMGKGGVWEHEENKMFTEKGARNYNRFRGFCALILGVFLVILGVGWL